jgi:tyrosine-protein phosphatase SIW14
VRLTHGLALRYPAALLLALSLSTPVFARTSHADTRTGINDASTIRIDNFGRVNSNYYRGAQPKGHDYADLAKLGVKTFINLTSDDAMTNEKAMVEEAGMAYFQIPMTTHKAPTPAQLSDFLRVVNDPASQPLYVHCVGGRHRTGVMTAVYRMTRDGWTADQAFKEMKQYKFGADFLHPEFKEFVYGYGAQLARTAPSRSIVETAKSGG